MCIKQRPEFKPFFTEDGRKWCACGDGIDDEMDQCEICDYFDKVLYEYNEESE